MSSCLWLAALDSSWDSPLVFLIFSLSLQSISFLLLFLLFKKEKDFLSFFNILVFPLSRPLYQTMIQHNLEILSLSIWQKKKTNNTKKKDGTRNKSKKKMLVVRVFIAWSSVELTLLLTECQCKCHTRVTPTVDCWLWLSIVVDNIIASSWNSKFLIFLFFLLDRLFVYLFIAVVVCLFFVGKCWPVGAHPFSFASLSLTWFYFIYWLKSAVVFAHYLWFCRPRAPKHIHRLTGETLDS